MPGHLVIYASATLSLAMLERLVQRGDLAHTLLVEARVPDDLEIEELPQPLPTGWRSLGSPEAAEAGTQWIGSMRTAVLRVPSALVPQEANYLVNPKHPDAARIMAGVAEPVEWDERLLGMAAGKPTQL